MSVHYIARAAISLKMLSPGSVSADDSQHTVNSGSFLSKHGV